MLSIALVLAAASAAEQLAPAKQGKIQCLAPIESTKTCDSLTKVTEVAPGRYTYDSESLLDADGPVIVSEHGTATVQGNRFCETVRVADANRLSFKVSGVPANAAQTARYRSLYRQKMALIAGQTLCSSIGPEEDGFHEVQAYLGTRAVPGLNYSMKWVGPNDGWKVAP